MPSQSTHQPEYIRQTQSYMEALKEVIRAYSNFGKLQGEVELEHRNGAESARDSVYLSGWELQGHLGTISVDASSVNGAREGVITRLTLKPFGTARAEAVFGEGHPHTNSLPNVLPTIQSWIDLVTGSSADPFAGTKLPSRS